MSDCYEGDGFEFSIRLPDRRRIQVHVTRAALEFLGGDAPIDQLSVLVDWMDLLHERALLLHARTGAELVMLEPEDLDDVEEAGMPRPRTLH
ncbi:hypothetical protein M2282_000600 [Variovorax boronicumulans]|uniref:hypothetical protein n=1 Tax=Variovorax boronicumulans TaxID=436515 RepID=UPI00247469B0|nr:hypothetical protein [Variovorax boronicumulans]MDH6165472.1 hypothetical protein [Variovorax boronicumulans]